MSATSDKYEYNLGAVLHPSRWTYEQRIGGSVLLYSPDFIGMPILVSPDVYDLYIRFDGGVTVGQVLQEVQASRGGSFVPLLNGVSQLFERGFLRPEADPDRFPRHQCVPSKKAMSVWLHITNYCNLACSYCFVHHSQSRMSDTTLAEAAANIVATVEKYQVEDVLVKFAGGEPTLACKQMEWFRDQLTAKLKPMGVKLHWTVLTNGTLVTDRFLGFVRSAGATVSISIDGYGPQHDLYRVYRNDKSKGSWDDILHNIDVLRANGTIPYINIMVGPKTSAGLPDVADWVFGNGMIATIHVVRNVDDSWELIDDRRAEQYQAYCDQLQTDFECMFRRLESPRYRMSLPRWMEIAELHFESPTQGICCGIGADHIVITHEGRVASCPMTVNDETVPVRDGDLFAATSRTFDPRPGEAQDECLECQWYGVCASACPVANQRIKGHAYRRSPLCAFWQYVIPRYACFYGRKLSQLTAEPELTGVLVGDGPTLQQGHLPNLSDTKVIGQ